MTQEEKARAYDEAIKRAKEINNEHKAQPFNVMLKVFPELKESEDERMRKLCEVLVRSCFVNELCTKEEKDDCIDWLEKQGEQKFTNKVEPKFKKGDWVIDKQGIVHQIANVIENVTYHTYGYDIVGGGYFNDNTEGVRLWTIKDAKDGDVLQLGEVTAIFKEYIGNGDCKCYCSVYRGEFEIPTQDSSYGCYNATPATKEQRDTLFAKMHEAGYEWDAEKLELIKVPKTKESEGALKKLLDEQDKLYKEAKNILENKDTALAFLRRTGIIDEYGELADKYRSDQTPATTISAVNGTNSTAITDGNTSVTSKEVERQYCTGQYEPDVREFPIEWKEENVDELSEFERAMMHIGGSFFGENAGLDPNNTNDVKEQAELLLSLVPKQGWSEEDEKMYLSIMSVLLSTIGTDKTGFTVTREIDWMKSLKDKVQSLSQPKEWSEEDEQYLLVCKNALAKYQITNKWDAGIISRWLENKLKSLKERVQPQQKPTWSEEVEP